MSAAGTVSTLLGVGCCRLFRLFFPSLELERSRENQRAASAAFPVGDGYGYIRVLDFVVFLR